MLTNLQLARVAILIPTHSEPKHVLADTLRACCNQNYDSYVVVVCDDTNRSEIRELAQAFGCQYIGKSNDNHNKAGNLNNALPLLGNVEFLAVCDAGDVLYPNFLSTLLPILTEHPTYAFVQGLLEPGNPDKLQEALGMRFFPASSQQRRHVIGSLFGDEHVGCHGSGFLIRRRAVEELGGFPWKCLSDDTYLSLLLYLRGWKSVRNSEVVANAPNPGGLVNMVEQQIRWMVGVLQILSLWPNPLFSSKIPLRARLRILLPHLTKAYESIVILVVLLPLFFLFRSGAPSPLLQWGLVGAIVVSMIGQLGCALARRRTFWWEALYVALAAWPAARALLRFIKDPWGQPFRVTDKSSARGLDGKAAKALTHPLWAYLFAYSLGLVFYFSRLEDGWQHLAYSTALFAWVAYNAAAVGQSIAIIWHSTRGAITDSVSEASL